MLKALRRLYGIATCTHRNVCKSLVFEDTTEIVWCTACGRLISFTDEGTRRHNPHKLNNPF